MVEVSAGRLDRRLALKVQTLCPFSALNTVWRNLDVGHKTLDLEITNLNIGGELMIEYELNKLTNGLSTISVIICTLNEAENLPHVLPKIPNWVGEVILVDGHSTDNTVEVARKLSSDIKVLYQPGKGKGDALKCGIENATGDIIVTLDADGATPPEEMSKFIEPLLNGYDFTKGSRFAVGLPQGKPWYRILGNWIITLTFNLLFFRRYTDLCSGYNAFWRKRLKDINLWSSDGFENEPLINVRAAKARLKVTEVGYGERVRIGGEVKERSWRQGLKAIKPILRERFFPA